MPPYHIQRIESQPSGGSELICMGTEEPTRVTVRDLGTGIDSTLTLCYDPSHGTACTLCDALRAAGYEPADWDVECPPI